MTIRRTVNCQDEHAPLACAVPAEGQQLGGAIWPGRAPKKIESQNHFNGADDGDSALIAVVE